MRIVVVGGTGTAGSAAVRAGQSRGHEMVVASRSAGVDARTGEGLAAAVTGADAVIDLCSVPTLSQRKASRFFVTAAQNILAAAERAGVPHVVRLSVIGVDRNPHGFYAAQLQMEGVYDSSAVPTTILRAAQFHEFAAQTLQRASLGPLCVAPRARVQPVAVGEVGARVVSIAEAEPLGRARDLAGPREEELSAMVRAYARRVGRRGPIPAVNLPGAMMRGLRQGLSLPDADAQVGEQTFEMWLDELPAGA